MLRVNYISIILFIIAGFYASAQDTANSDTLNTKTNSTQTKKIKKNLYQEAGFSHKIQYGQFFGLGNSDGNKYKFDYTFIFRINKHISAGPGTSLEIYPTGSSTIAVPVYFDLNYNVNDDTYSPYFNLGTGYTIGYGYYYKAGGGLNVASSEGHYILNFGLQLDFINNPDKDVPASLGIVVGLNF
jgi:hypothetical protein